MTHWLRRRRDADPDAAVPAAELLKAVAALAIDDVKHAQAVAFAVARAIREADEAALPALAMLLTATKSAPSLNEGTVINLLSALQYATLLPGDVRAGWAPPAAAVASLVERAMEANTVLRDQAEGVLWALADDGLITGWLGAQVARDLANRVDSTELKNELLRRPRPFGLVAEEEEYPCAAA
jgi:hypothetical protein